MLRWIGRRLASYLSKPIPGSASVPGYTPAQLAGTLRKGDVLLVHGISRFGVAIRYLTQSSWSHSALCVADPVTNGAPDLDALTFIEADVKMGVRRVPLRNFAMSLTRICRPVGLTPADLETVVEYTTARLGHTYDLKNIIDLARYLIQKPPVPERWRRRLIALGSGEPSKAICSSLIAQGFQAVRYPILPEVTRAMRDDPSCRDCVEELLHVRHHSLFTPSDFDLSPYFRIVKPAADDDFDYRALHWEGAD